MSQRIQQCFARTAAEQRPALIPFIMAGDPDMTTTLALLPALRDAGADLIEVGMPFSDPSADGPAIQAAGLRALRGGVKLRDILACILAFREQDSTTPIILMGYYNPVLHYGLEAFARDATASGVDGVILVDLPPEEEAEYREHADSAGMDFIRLIAPTTGDERLSAVLASASGFVYTIAVKGITGASSATSEDLAARVGHIKRHTNLPVVAGFGIRRPEQAAALKGIADGVVIGSALIDCMQQATGSKTEAAARFIRTFRSVF